VIKKIVIMVLSCCLLAVRAGAIVRLEMDYNQNQAELNRLKAIYPGAVEVYGEIVAISPDEIKLRTCQETTSFRLDPETRMFCNGQPAIWKALLPVAVEAYFEARLIVVKDRVVAADGFYYGEEVIINGWEYSGGELMVELSALSGERAGVYSITTNAGLFPVDRWLEEGRTVFVLYGMQGRIRGVFL
jgi:hypothetical protein